MKEVFFSNYDYGIEEDLNESPGNGLYWDMNKYKSIKEFLELKRKKRKEAFYKLLGDS